MWLKCRQSGLTLPLPGEHLTWIKLIKNVLSCQYELMTQQILRLNRGKLYEEETGGTKWKYDKMRWRKNGGRSRECWAIYHPFHSLAIEVLTASYRRKRKIVFILKILKLNFIFILLMLLYPIHSFRRISFSNLKWG